jgi:hypothetical protein
MSARTIWQFFLVIALFLAAARWTGVAAQDATPPAEEGSEFQFGARPEGGADGQRFEVEIEPGGTAQLTLLLSNAGEIPLALHSFTSNVRTAVNGGLTMDQEGTELTAPASWMDFPSETVELTPGQEVPRTITITVPEGTAPGRYVNALAVQTVDDYAIEGSRNFRQRVRKVLAVYITVPGEMKGGFTLGDPLVEVRVRGPVIQIPVQNTGNLRLRPYGELTLFDSDSRELITAPVVMGSVFAGHRTLAEVRLEGLLPPGEYRLSVSMRDDESGATASLEKATLVMPEPEEEAAPNPITVESIAVTPNPDPIQFAGIAVDLGNAGEVIPGSKLTMSVFHDGAFVEDFVLADSLALNAGITTVQQRYIPLTGSRRAPGPST